MTSMLAKRRMDISLRMSSPIETFCCVERSELSLRHDTDHDKAATVRRINLSADIPGNDNTQRLTIRLRVLYSLHKSGQRVFRISIQHAGHRLEEQRILKT